MGIKLSRKKRRNFKLSIAYRMAKLIPLSAMGKLKLFLDMSWIFSRLAHEQTFKANINLASGEEDMVASFISPDAFVLDIGCGEGHVIKRIFAKTRNIVGVDYDQGSIRRARNKFPDTTVNLICDDVFNYLKVNPSLKFDYVILSHVIEHIDDPLHFFHSLKSKSRFFYIEVPDFESTHLNLYRRAVHTDLIYSDADHVHEFDRKELEAIFLQAGLEIIKSEFRFGVMKYWCRSADF